MPSIKTESRIPMPPGELALEPISNLNWRKTLGVRTHPAQLKFVADHEPVALVILSKSFVRAGNVDWYPFAITMNGAPVGVVGLTHNERTCKIFHLVIDREQQDRGLGKASVSLIVDYVRKNWPTVQNIALTVHPQNEKAMHVYTACGFATTGELEDSEPVMVMAL